MNRKTSTSFTGNDAILLAAVLAAAAIMFIAVVFSRRAGGSVSVRLNGSETARYPLAVDRTVVIEGEGGTNLLVIEGGKARVSEADCPDKLCVNQGSIRYSGQSVVCLPHKVTVVIEDGDSDGIDAVAK